MKGCRNNIIDTPAPPIFREVERIHSRGLVLLHWTPRGGPMPPDPYVPGPRAPHGLKPIVYINKVDRKSRPDMASTHLDLFFELAPPRAG
jgi:predicted membrane GTPase involved in stress response